MQPTRIRSSGVDSEITLGNLSVTGNTVLGNTFVGNLFYANGAVFVSGSGSGVSSSNWIKRTANYTAVSGDRIIADTSAGSFSITLPAAPTVGHYVQITDGANFYANPLTVQRNGSTIEGQSVNVLVDTAAVDLELIYDGATWQVVSTYGPVGFTGSAGTNGTAGFTGSAGFVGSAGSAGVNGFTGSAGSIGFTGSAGTGGGGTVAANAQAFCYSIIFGG